MVNSPSQDRQSRGARRGTRERDISVTVGPMNVLCATEHPIGNRFPRARKYIRAAAPTRDALRELSFLQLKRLHLHEIFLTSSLNDALTPASLPQHYLRYLLLQARPPICEDISTRGVRLAPTSRCRQTTTARSSLERLAREAARLWRAWRTVHEMVQDRGYELTEEEVKISLDQFKANFTGPDGTIEYALAQLHAEMHTETW